MKNIWCGHLRTRKFNNVPKESFAAALFDPFGVFVVLLQPKVEHFSPKKQKGVAQDLSPGTTSDFPDELMTKNK